MSDKQAAFLIIENIAMLEEANRLLQGELSKNVFAAIDKTIQTWAKKMDWDGAFEFWTEKDFYFGPKQWQPSSEQSEDWIGWFSIDAVNPDKEEWLTTLLAARQGEIGFKFTVDYVLFPNVGKRAWRAFASQQNHEHPEIEKAGFQFDPREGSWFLPWKIDAKRLAQAYVDDAIEDALGPLREALERIKDVDPTLATLVESAQHQFGVDRAC